MKRINWTKTTLGAIADFSNGGAWSQDEYVANGVRVVRVSDVKGDTLDMSECKFLSVNALEKYSKNLLKAGDLMICTVGSHPNQPASVVGRAVVIPKNVHGALLNQNAVRLRPSVPSLSAGWLGFLGRSKGFHDYIIGCARGAASQVRMPIGLLKEMPIAVPPTTTQQKIASILSAYDDLIENNTRRIAILEEMARRLYEEWFVRFRFPGHEGVPMVESELGLVPQGWVAATIGDAASYVNRGLSPKYDESAACLVLNQKCIRDQRLTLGVARRQSKPVPADKLLQFGDVLINSTGVGTLGRVAQVQENLTNCTADSHVSIVRAGDNCDLDYFGLSLFAQQAHFEAQGVGSTGQTELSRARISETSIVLPPLNVQQQFGKLVRPMRNLAIILQNKNQNLRTTRDLLLPKLISGELDVSTLPEPLAETV